MTESSSAILLDESAAGILSNAFENLKDVVQEVMQDVLKKSMLKKQHEIENVLLKENKKLESKCRMLEDDHERFAKKVNKKLETWTSNFHILKKKYRQLKKIHESVLEQTDLSELQDIKKNKIVDSAKMYEKIIDENLEDINANKIETNDVSISTLATLADTAEGEESVGIENFTDEMKIAKHNAVQTQGVNADEMGDIVKRSPMKQTHLYSDYLKSRRKGNVKYQEKQQPSHVKHDSDVLKMHLNRGTTSEQVKRLVRDDSYESEVLELEKKAKEPQISAPTNKVLLLDTQDDNLSRISDCSNAMVNVIAAESHGTDHPGSFVTKDLNDNSSVENEVKSPDPDATEWHPTISSHNESLKGTVGIPFQASTPNIDACQGKDFDETVWYGPKSPSVVSSMYPTPKRIKTESSPKESDKDGKDVNFKRPGRKLNLKDYEHNERLEAMSPCIFSSFHSNNSIDSPYKAPLAPQGSKSKQRATAAGIFHRVTKTEDVASENKVTAGARMRYKYNAVFRKREDRDKMDGYQCKECADWYKDDANDDDKKQHLKHVCRHKAISSPPPATPKGFWSLGFPETQECIEKGYMLDEKISVPSYAMPKRKKDKAPS
eukprot:gene17667-19428_t